MGGGNCPYERQCRQEDKRLSEQAEEKRILDLAEQKARIEKINAETALLVKEKIKRDLNSMGDK